MTDMLHENMMSRKVMVMVMVMGHIQSLEGSWPRPQFKVEHSSQIPQRTSNDKSLSVNNKSLRLNKKFNRQI